MAGMTTTGLPKFSDYSVRNVVIKVTGLCRQDVMKTSHYEVKIPFSLMSQTIETIHRMGGKVSSVCVDSSSSSEGEE